MMQRRKELLIITTLIAAISILSSKIVEAQSTCPVVQTNGSGEQKCKCGIKIDGHIYIYCARKQLSRLPKFTRSSILYDELILSGNRIEKIQANSFTGLKVKRLLLDDNPIDQIEPHSFTELANYLEELVLSGGGQQRTRLASNILFQSLLNLKVLKLSTLLIDEDGILHANLFNRTRKLESIGMVDCGLSRVERGALSGVEASLRELNLDNNLIDVASDVFTEVRRMKRLQVLNLSRNRIRHMLEYTSSGGSFNLDPLSVEALEIDLSFNGIVTIDERAFGSRLQNGNNDDDGLTNHITRLNLNNNELNQFQLNFITQLERLKELHLDYNKIEYIVDNLFINARQLEVLSLKGNLIQKLNSEYVFSGLHFSLRRLNLAANRLQFINRRALAKAMRLRELNLERNCLSVQLDSAENLTATTGIFDGVETELRYLNLEYNGLKARHLFALSGLINLESVKLGNNDLADLYVKSTRVSPRESVNSNTESNTVNIAKIFEYYRNLTYIDMQNSSLRQVPYFHGLNTTLISLNLAHNRICHVHPSNLVYHYSRVKYLNLNLNPLRCDCRVVPLRRWLDEAIEYTRTTVGSGSTASTTTNYTSIGFEMVPPSSSSSSSSPTIQAVANFNWKCATPLNNRNRLVSKLYLSQMTCEAGEEDESNGCLLDEAYFDAERPTTTTTTTTTTTKSTTTTTTTTSTTAAVSTAARREEIRIIDSQTMKFASPSKKIVNSQSTRFGSNFPEIMTTSQQEQQQQQTEVSSPTSSLFFTTSELKQTLLGSFIGAVSVIFLVGIAVCGFKATRTKLLSLGSSRGSSNDTSTSTEKDKSATTTTTTATLPYELGKLSLQTLCINSTGCSSSSSSSASSSSSSSNETNTSCVCGNNNTAAADLFTKMDPMRLTLISQNHLLSSRSSFHQNYLNPNNPNHHYLHYLTSNVPVVVTESSPTQSISISPNSDNLKSFNYLQSTAAAADNTYDKLHQQRTTMTSSAANIIRPQAIIPTKNGIAVFNTLNPNFLNCTSTLAASRHHPTEMVNCETTPFLIIRSPNNHHLFEENCFNTIESSPRIINDDDQQTQHTYHEIGDVLIQPMKRTNNNNNNTQSTEINSVSVAKTNEMYI